MRSRRVSSALALLVSQALAAGCSQRPADRPPTHIPSAPPEQPRVDFAAYDKNGDRLDDAFVDELKVNADTTRNVLLEVRLKTPVTRAEVDAFEALGGSVMRVYENVAWGWVGTLPLGNIGALKERLGASLDFVYHARQIKHHMIEASRTGRARPVWAAGFAGAASGYNGTSDIIIGIVDTGVDFTHTDLSTREAGWKDWSSSARTSPWDDDGHGTGVAGVAAGTGASFGLGNATLNFTSTNINDTAAGGTAVTPIHTPAYFGGSGINVTGKLYYTGGTQSSEDYVYAFASDGSQSYTGQHDVSGASPISNSYSGSTAAIFTPFPEFHTNEGKIKYAATADISSYPSVGDGFNALRGVASSAMLYGERIAEDNWEGSGSDVYAIEAIDDLISNKAKIINVSFSGNLGMSNAATAAVSDGIVVTIAAGNGGPTASMDTFASTSTAITAGATNDQNALTYYSNAGTTSDGIKPDLVAPGGSAYRSMVLVPDSNSDDALDSSFADVQANDYTAEQGTSFAAPFTAGAAALVIDAMQKSGTTWTWSGSSQPLFVKMLLQATATETNTNREAGTGGNPSLGRASTPKDIYEGSGIINPDAAVEAVAETLSLPFSDTVANASLTYARRAWARHMSLIPGSIVSISCTMDSTADYDVYLYSPSPDSNGNPVILASSTNTSLGATETLSYTSTTLQTAYFVVKRVSGYGKFTCSGTIDSSKCGNGTLDTGEQCDPNATGVNASCCNSSCVAAGTGVSCNDNDACTFVDHCDGAGACTHNGHRLCAALDQCHDVGTCDPSTGVCSNPTLPDNTGCDDSSLCTSNDVCKSGVCTGTTSVFCTAKDSCHTAGTCDPDTGTCSNPTGNEGGTCDDGNKCTTGDVCTKGTCAGTTVTCTASDACHTAGTCNSSTGVCSNPTGNEGGTCDDGNKCTTGDKCTSGTCAGTTVTCTAKDACHTAGTCNSSTGVCSNPTGNEGGTCDDGNKCTTGDKCTSGTCAGSAVTCTAVDQCHNAGTCQSATGTCSTGTAKSNGTSCDDGNKCTTNDQCTSGSCGGSAVSCTAVDQCHNAGTCQSATGTCSTGTAKSNGTSCDDGNKCTTNDQCTSGSCGGSAVVCSAPDQCHNAGSCQSATGTCSAPTAKSDNTPCDDKNACTSNDVCVSGSCGGTALTCTASDQCHTTGMCDASTGKCTNPTAPPNTTCNDQDPCTTGDVCNAGVCAGTEKSCPASGPCTAGSCDGSGNCTTVNVADGTPCGTGCGASCLAGACVPAAASCTASDQCHVAGTCNPATGTCSNPTAPDDTTCDDADKCTTNDVCTNGTCAGTAVVCTAMDECHSAGSCDGSTGLCSNPPVADGTPCSSFKGECERGACVLVDGGVTNVRDMTTLPDMTRPPPDMTRPPPPDMTRPPPPDMARRPPPDMEMPLHDMAMRRPPPDMAMPAMPPPETPDLATETPADLATETPPDLASPSSSGPGEAGDMGHPAAPVGCACDVGGPAPAGPSLLLAAFALVFLLRRRLIRRR